MANDDLDDLLRHAMKTLDDEVSSGYFEDLPSRTLARLEDRGMQTSSSGTDIPSGPHAQRSEDSGLHDIRNLASSARMRISSKRITTSPPQDDDLLASSSGGWKAVALPEPAKMVSLPDIAPADLKKAEKADRKSRKSREMVSPEMPAERTSAPELASGSAAASLPSLAAATAQPAVEAPLHLDDVPSIPATAVPETASSGSFGANMIGARIAERQSNRGRNVLLGTIGAGLAAAAGVMIYLQVANKSSDDAAPARAGAPAAMAEEKAAKDPAPEPVVQAITEGKDGKDGKDGNDDAAVAVDEPKADESKDDAKAEEPAPPAVEPDKHPAKAPPHKSISKKPGKKKIIEVDTPDPKPTKTKPEVKPAPEKPKGNEPDFNDLLKEAGVDPNKPVAKPKLAKKSLSGADFKAGMGGISGRALGCYKGEQGMAAVKLVIAPSGQVTKAHVTGQFAGTPVAACVESAVRAATFPPWDGGPQTFAYSFLLQEK